MSKNTTFTKGTVLVLVGTKRGLFLLSSKDRERWEVTSTALSAHRIFYAALDQREGRRLFAADNGDFFGTFLRYSDDFGQTWQEPEQGIQFAQESGEKLANIWVIEPRRPSAYLLTRGVRIVALLHCKKTFRVKETTPCFPQSHFLH